MDFLDIISCPEGVNIGMRNISLSTCGLVPGIDKLAERKLQLTLSVSLHAPDNVTRSSMMPVNDAFRRKADPGLPPATRKRPGGASALNIPWSMVSMIRPKWQKNWPI